ncbi:MAG TPA: hypothetical protein VGK67_24600 [Myxococcales bacterium]
MKVPLKIPWLRFKRSARLFYADVSSRRDVEDEAAVVPEILEPLADLRFELAGYMEQRAGDRSYVTMVLTDPEELSFTRPEWLFGLPHASFKTMLEDGAIVDTRNTARRALLDWLPLLAPYQHHPAAGYLLENVGRAPPDEVWTRHRERVKQIVAQRRTRVRPHDMALCTAIMNRSWALVSARATTGLVVGLPAWLGLSLLAFHFLPVAAGIAEVLLALPLSLVFVGGLVARRWPVPLEPPSEVLGVEADRAPDGQLLQ